MAESYIYPDDGCKYGGESCLSCALPECVHDLVDRGVNMTGYVRKVRVLYLHAQGTSLKDIAVDVGIAPRSVLRLLERAQT